MMRLRYLLPAMIVLVGAATLGLGYWNARADPVVRRASVGLPDWPAGAAPVTIALLSDIHMAGASMDEGRLTGIVAQVNALRPDLVVIAGDFIQGHGGGEATHAAAPLVAALRRLHAPLGVLAVLGNHDHWTDAPHVRRMLAGAGIRLLDNDAARAGPLAVGGVDDAFTRHDRPGAMLARLRGMPGARVVLTHSPDIVPDLPEDVQLVLAGHTHCGQVVLPVIGPVEDVSRWGARYRCGMVREGARTTIVTAGLGTSDVPLRYGAPTDLWLVRVGPAPGG